MKGSIIIVDEYERKHSINVKYIVEVHTNTENTSISTTIKTVNGTINTELSFDEVLEKIQKVS